MTDILEYKIELEQNAKLFAKPIRREAQSQIDGIIEKSTSPWASAYVLSQREIRRVSLMH